MSIETIGTQIDAIDVRISYRIIELFSGGLYSSPNKAFEELVCNSYDAFADKVCVSVPSDPKEEGSCIWVCDNGESMDQQELKDLWMIGETRKRTPERDRKRLQIGRFGIGKLATFVLANKLTHICKKEGRFLGTTMDFRRIPKGHEILTLTEREIDQEAAKEALAPYLSIGEGKHLRFDLFGSNAVDTWTFALLTELKPKAAEIKEGRLKWVLRTALPLNPGFELFYNGRQLHSSKISMPIRKSWIIGKNDVTAERLNAACRQDGDEYYVDFHNLKNLHGRIDLYEDSLLHGKSSELGRSHGIFLMVRDRLINLDDPLLGMDAFSHGVFNRARIILHADQLDDNLASTRESIKESKPYWELQDYITKKFNNEVKKFYFAEENKKQKEKNIAYRLSTTSLALSKRPLYVFAKKFFNNEIDNPIIIEKPFIESKTELLRKLEREFSDEESIIKKVDYSILGTSDPIAKFDLTEGLVKINLLHPFVANFSDLRKILQPIEFVAITEVLTEAFLYEQGLDELLINEIIRRRDNVLRKLSLSDRQGAPVVAQMLKDSISDPTELEDAVYNAFLALGFEATKIGGRNKPDGKAEAVLGYGDEGKSKNYSFTYDAKSTEKRKIQAATAKISGIKRHQKDYDATYSVVIAVDYEGADDPNSAISKEARQQKVTCMRARDLIRLLLLSVPYQIGLAKLQELFQTCHTPAEITEWISEITSSTIYRGPVKEVLDAIYDLQKNDTEAPDISSVRMQLKHDNIDVSKKELISLVESLRVLMPGYINVEKNRVGVQCHPDKIMKAIYASIQEIPSELQQKYLDAFSSRNEE